MKKVAIVLCLSTFLMLILVLGGKMASHGHLSAKNPDELPIYLITLGNFRETPAVPATQSCIANETEKVPMETAKDIMNLAFKYIQDNYRKK
ncbi:hypothetical protein [Chitinophaga sp. RAB17]|uniref:hypothetical protein n=1 Tax=Chitinophaga sp. RAB17 TaxID=3233049 RepID=UPI003F918CEC